MDVLKAKYGLDVEQLKPLSLVVLASDNGVLASKKLPLEAFADRKALNEEVREFTKAHALPRPDAKELLAAACNRLAKKASKCCLRNPARTAGGAESWRGFSTVIQMYSKPTICLCESTAPDLRTAGR